MGTVDLNARSGLERIFSRVGPWVPPFSLGFSGNTDRKVYADSFFLGSSPGDRDSEKASMKETANARARLLTVSLLWQLGPDPPGFHSTAVDFTLKEYGLYL